MKTTSRARREILWLCLPIVLVIGIGAYISQGQSERLAEQRRRESGPLRLRIWGIRNMGVQGDDRAVGLDYRYRMDAHIEGAGRALAPGEIWVLRAKSAQFVVGKVSENARLINISAPLVLMPGEKRPRAEVVATDAGDLKLREVGLWVECDTALANPDLKIEVEAVAGKVVPMSKKPGKMMFKPSGPRLAAPAEIIPLRPYQDSDDQANIVKSNW